MIVKWLFVFFFVLSLISGCATIPSGGERLAEDYLKGECYAMFSYSRYQGEKEALPFVGEKGYQYWGDLTTFRVFAVGTKPDGSQVCGFQVVGRATDYSEIAIENKAISNCNNNYPSAKCVVYAIGNQIVYNKDKHRDENILPQEKSFDDIKNTARDFDTKKNQKLTIRFYDPDFNQRLRGSRISTLALDGLIDSDAPDRLAPVLEKIKPLGANVYLNSTGGDLHAGMKIGRMLRAAGFDTHIGTVGQVQRVDDPDLTFVMKNPGKCYGACAVAYLGGIFRFITPESSYGTHNFSNNDNLQYQDLKVGDLLTAGISDYLDEMGVSNDLFSYFAKKDKESVSVLSYAELSEMRIINNGRTASEWKVESVGNKRYLRGTQKSIFGAGKVIILCDHKYGVFFSFYDAGEKRSKEIASGSWVHSILTESGSRPLTNPVKFEEKDGEVVSVFKIGRKELQAFSKSNRIGHAMQVSQNAPTFLGYHIDIIEKKDRQTTENYLFQCLR